MRALVVRIDSVGIMFITASLLILMYASTFPAVMGLSLTSAVLLIAGVTFSLTFRTAEIRPGLKPEHLIYSLLGLGAMLLANIAVFRLGELAVAPFDITWFLILVAVSEEVMVRGFLLPWFVQRFRSVWLGIAASSLVWTIYHFYVSGGDETYLVSVFVAGLVLGYITYRSGSLTPALIAHVANNLLAAF